MFSALFLIIALLMGASPKAQAKIDLQWAICDSSPEKVLSLLNQDHSEPTKLEQIAYYETFPNTFAESGISLRVKSKKGKLESSIKIRYSNEENAPENADCTWDRYGNKKAYTCEVKHLIPENANSQWSHQQKLFLQKEKQIEWPHFVKLGPYLNPKWTFEINKYEVHFDYIESGISALSEISVKVKDGEEKEAFTNISSHLKKHGIKLCPAQEGKTLRLLKDLENYPHPQG